MEAVSEDGYAPEFLAVIRQVNENFPQPDWTRPDPLGNIEQCIVYTRLSRQDDKSHSPETQRFACEQLAKGQGWKILKVVDRDALHPISGKSFEARPGWDEVKAFVGTLKWSERRRTCVLVKSFDRFSRDTAEGAITADEFRDELEVRLRAADTPFIAPEMKQFQGRIMFLYSLVQAEAERLNIKERTIAGLATARRKGKHLGEFPNYFEKDAAGRIVPTTTAKRIAELRASGCSYQQIGDETGIDRLEAYHCCEFLADQKARLEVD